MIDKPKNVIISIKPEYALKIISGEKTIELRRRFPVESVIGGTALIYASSPIREIIGYAVIKEVRKLSVDKLWETCRKQACVSKDFFYSYFEGVDAGYALTLNQPVKLAKPIDIKRLEEEFLLSAPQSFRYAPDSVLDCVAA